MFMFLGLGGASCGLAVCGGCVVNLFALYYTNGTTTRDLTRTGRLFLGKRFRRTGPTFRGLMGRTPSGTGCGC